ncbi:hypothetical protein ZMTM_24620 [Methyloradius palustris]|uniref:Uncharacterized protein n=2 Tax=Methyloradius palustris TaxID=2778876 RepID=A0A8D5K1Y9_9PROT|nr:hypothetical protein ZMTM_24620 [Methyloradius palustris]
MLALNRKMFETHHEFALGVQLVLKRELFGRCYQALLTDYFDSMPKNSGAMISIFLPMQSLMPSVSFPGDIDLLIIPYEGNHLIVSEAMAVELKAVRAKFSNQGKSPNEFGFSQAEALLKLGFPYAGLAHLIVSDQSPVEFHQKMKVATIIDEVRQTAELTGDALVDIMPMHLMERSFGRLMANCKNQKLGLLASYIGDEGLWFPVGRSASRNPKTDNNFLQLLGEYFQSNSHRFINIPRYPRPNTSNPQTHENKTSHTYSLSRLHKEVSSIFVLKHASPKS